MYYVGPRLFWGIMDGHDHSCSRCRYPERYSQGSIGDAACRQYHCGWCVDNQPVRGCDHGQLRLLDARLVHPRSTPSRRVRQTVVGVWPRGQVSSHCHFVYDTIRYDTRCYYNVRSKADISQLNLPHGTDNWKSVKTEKLKSKKPDMLSSNSKQSGKSI